jgi:putative PEP-CTERM system histidine kinase
MHGREMEAFQAMSTFFVHDLKNAASSLNLMLQNLPEHFDDPEFRADALRAIGSTVGRIKQIIERLGTLRQKLELRTTATDLNALVEEVLAQMGGLGDVEVRKDLQPVPPVEADAEQLTTVITNLVLNAREAVGRDGRITLGTSTEDGRAVLTVGDNGAGMSAEFLRTSLFRPFQTTKKKGLGIGMFQSKLIVEAHRGVLHVDSSPGVGTTFRLLLPLTPSRTPRHTPNQTDEAQADDRR